jgi:ElaB/YqjD/DUF883 family membrane-anchored ribosome-binding protein
MATTTLTANLSDTAARVQEKAADAFRTGRIATADALDSTAARINAGGDRVAEAAHSTADRLGATASYMRDNGPREMVGDIESLIRAHPGKSLIVAAVLGFLAGRAFNRN